MKSSGGSSVNITSSSIDILTTFGHGYPRVSMVTLVKAFQHSTTADHGHSYSKYTISPFLNSLPWLPMCFHGYSNYNISTFWHGYLCNSIVTLLIIFQHSRAGYYGFRCVSMVSLVTKFQHSRKYHGNQCVSMVIYAYSWLIKLWHFNVLYIVTMVTIVLTLSQACFYGYGCVFIVTSVSVCTHKLPWLQKCCRLRSGPDTQSKLSEKMRNNSPWPEINQEGAQEETSGKAIQRAIPFPLE